MKKIFVLLVSLLFFANFCNAQKVMIPYDSFRDFLKNKYPSCFDSFDSLDITCGEIVNEDSLNIYGLGRTGLNYLSLEGIQYFTSLKYLNCTDNAIISSPPLPATLKFLNWSFNGLGYGGAYLPPMPEGLTHLICTNCYLGYFNNRLPSTLTYLDCSNNTFNGDQFAEFYYGLTNLNTFICKNQFNIAPYSHSLSFLPLLPNSITYLDCSDNALSSLPVLPASLKYFNCSGNYANTNPETTISTLAALPAFPDSLVTLVCSYNIISKMPKFPKALKFFYADNNILSSLPTLPDSLKVLSCTSNQIYCLPKLPAGLKTLNYDVNKITCIPNSCAAAPNAQICNPANNINHCNTFPIISGKVFSDINSNGIKDENEQFMKKVKVILSNAVYTFTDNNGGFTLGADSLGSYSLSVNSFNYYTSVPSIKNFHFTNYDTLVTQNFALQPNVIFENVQISITPYNSSARPGFSYPYLLNYENTGTSTVSANINFVYDNLLLVYDSSSNADINNNGSSLNTSVNNFVPGQQGSFIAYFTIKSTAQIGSTIINKTTITANTSTANDSSIAQISGSYDPNEKEATPLIPLAKVLAGRSNIDYTIHFQNTGNDTAFNIVVSDTLNDRLLINTCQLINSSHQCKTTIKNNIVFFEFLNINLPDSNINEINSHGFVRVKIQPQPSVSGTTTVSNKAFIYFDYNTPIATNTASTVIQAPSKMFAFTGNGNWSDAANWSNGQVPAAVLPSDAIVVIEPVTNGECILNVPISILPGAVISVQKGKRFTITGNLIIQ